MAAGRGYAAMGDLHKAQELWPKVQQLQSRLPRQDLLEFQAQEAFRAGDTPRGDRILESLLQEFPARTMPARRWHNHSSGSVKTTVPSRW